MIFRLIMVLAAATMCTGGAANAGSSQWIIKNRSGDVQVTEADERRPIFSARAYAQSLIPAEYQLRDHGAGNRCSIEVTVKPLSLLADILSFEITYRRVPGDCIPPLHNGGYHAVRAVHLESGREARLDELPTTSALLNELRWSREIETLLGDDARSSSSLDELFVRLDTATANQCDRRLSPASLSAFYFTGSKGAVPRLHVAFADTCGQLGDEPVTESIALVLSGAMSECADSVRILGVPPVQFRFVSSR